MEKEEMDDKEKELQTRFELLPKEIQDVITSSDYQMRLFDIAKKYKLTYEQLGVLEFDTTLTLLGVSHPDEYENNISDILKLDSNTLKNIISEIKDKVFAPIRAQLMQLYTKTDQPTNQPVVSTSEKNIFAQSGISIEGSTNTPETPVKTGMTENRTDMLKSIENPPHVEAKVLNEIPRAVPVTPQTPASSFMTSGLKVPIAPYAKPADAPAIPQTPKNDDIVANKLGNTFSMPAKDSDYSLKPVNTPPTQVPPTGDPYHEAIN